MGESTKFHPALSISNIKALFPITLDLHSSEYHSWAALFKVQARVHDVLDHIIPPSTTAEKEAAAKTKSDNPALWKRLDAAVLQWIYSTVSTDILTSILVDDDSAEEAWARVANLFHDNKNSRAMYLHKEFTNTLLVDFPSTNAYCNKLKCLADQLKNVGAPVNDQALVLKMLQGLTDQYANFVTVLQNKKTLPSFTSARSKLALEETTITERSKQDSPAIALAASDSGVSNSSPPSTVNRGGGQQQKGRSHGRGNKKNSGGSKQNNGGHNEQQTGGGRGGHRGGGQQGGQRPFTGQQGWPSPPWWYVMQQQGWTPPPCSYPTQPWAQPWGRQAGLPHSGILGPRPFGQQSGPTRGQQQQAFSAQQWAPTDINDEHDVLVSSRPKLVHGHRSYLSHDGGGRRGITS